MMLYLASLLAGLIDAVGGAYKDTPLEGFKWKVFPRSIVISLLIMWIPFSDNFFVQLLASGYLIRVVVETKKFIDAKGNYTSYWFKRIKDSNLYKNNN